MIKLFRHIRKSLLMENKTSKYFKYAIGEIVLVVIGILIALQINNWNENKKINRSINTTLTLLKDEIMTNRNKINQVKDYHVMVRDTLQKIDMPKTKEGIGKALTFWKGMRTPRLQDAAFQTSIQSGIGKEFDPELLKNLNNLYTYQDSYNNFTNQSAQIFFNADFTDVTSFGKMMASVQMTMNDLYFFEREFDNLFENTLTKIDSIYNK